MQLSQLSLNNNQPNLVETSNPSFSFLYLYEIIKMIPLSHMITKPILKML
jgi:hypothetical protein